MKPRLCTKQIWNAAMSSYVFERVLDTHVGTIRKSTCSEHMYVADDGYATLRLRSSMQCLSSVGECRACVDAGPS